MEEEIEDLTVKKLGEIVEKFPNTIEMDSACPVCGAEAYPVSDGDGMYELGCKCQLIIYRTMQHKKRNNEIEDFFENFETVV